MSITGTNHELLHSKKLANSKTSHFRIDLNADSKYTKSDEDAYLGRLRGTFSNHEYHIFDNGLKSTDMKPGVKGVERRQYGTIVYPPDKFGDKNPRKLEVYLPMVLEKRPTQYHSWPDNEYKKSNIFFEYNQQKLKKLTLERQDK